MAVSKAQLRTLTLLNKKAAHRVYRSGRSAEYVWVHADTHLSLTPTLHRLFTKGYATISPENRDIAVITEKGRAVVVQAA
jgi:DNA-binding PadR family transcriptional regulator